VLRRALHLLSRKEFSTWYGQQIAISGDFIGGICRYIAEFEKPGYIHSSLTEPSWLQISRRLLNRLPESSATLRL
jgi:hypothetical protein